MPRKANPYTRVTDICGFVDCEWYKWWIKKVGIEEAERISKESTTFGTGVHKIVESHLMQAQVDINQIYSDRQNFCAGLIIKWINESKVKPIILNEKPAIECELISEEYKFKGHPDLINTFGEDPVVWITDWKTSKDVRNGYVLQMSAYAQMLWENYKINCNDGVIIRTPSDPNAEKQFETHTVHNLRTKWFPLFLEALDIYNFFKKKGPYKESPYV